FAAVLSSVAADYTGLSNKFIARVERDVWTEFESIEKQLRAWLKKYPEAERPSFDDVLRDSIASTIETRTESARCEVFNVLVRSIREMSDDCPHPPATLLREWLTARPIPAPHDMADAPTKANPDTPAETPSLAHDPAAPKPIKPEQWNRRGKVAARVV